MTPAKLDDGVGPTALLLLGPLMYLQVPALVFAVLFSQGMRPLVAAAFAIPAGVALFLVLGAIVGDLLRGQSRRVPRGVRRRPSAAILCFSYYPALANQLSPKEVFESYQRLHKGSEPLALFGVGGRTAAYYAGGQPVILKDTPAAYEWLMGGESGAPSLAVRAEEPAAAQSPLSRAAPRTGTTYPCSTRGPARSSSSPRPLRTARRTTTRSNRIVFSKPPEMQKPLEVNLEDKLQVVGYDITDPAGKLVDHVAPGKKYHMRTYFKVLAPVTTEWEMFIHIDGFHRRHNGDHKMACRASTRCPLWLAGRHRDGRPRKVHA